MHIPLMIGRINFNIISPHYCIAILKKRFKSDIKLKKIEMCGFSESYYGEGLFKMGLPLLFNRPGVAGAVL